MKYLIGFIAALLALTLPKISAGTDSIIPFYMLNSASQFNIDVGLMYAICTVESKCKPRAINKDDATKDKKALGVKEHSLGLFQIKMATARSLGFHGTKKEFMKPEVNTYYAAKLLRHLYDRYGDSVQVISAYNAGKYTKANKKYVYKVLENYVHYKIDKHI